MTETEQATGCRKWVILGLTLIMIAVLLFRPRPDENVPADAPPADAEGEQGPEAASGSAPSEDVIAELLLEAEAARPASAPARQREQAALPSDPLSWSARQREQAARTSNPLHEAAVDGRETRMRALLNAGADPNALHKGLNFGWTPLHAAAVGGHPRIVRILITAGADPDIAEFGGQTPLHFAAINGRTDVVRALLDWNADPDIADSEGNTPLALAVMFERAGIARMLQAAGAR